MLSNRASYSGRGIMMFTSSARRQHRCTNPPLAFDSSRLPDVHTLPITVTTKSAGRFVGSTETSRKPSKRTRSQKQKLASVQPPISACRCCLHKPCLSVPCSHKLPGGPRHQTSRSCTSGSCQREHVVKNTAPYMSPRSGLTLASCSSQAVTHGPTGRQPCKLCTSKAPM